MKKILTIFGTRPEAIKMAPLVNELKKHSESFEVLVCVTAQHREMLDQVLDIFDIKPDYDLDIMKPGQDLFDITSKVLLGIKDILKKEKPNIVLVHGDTTTSMAAAMAAFYEQIPVGHVEAGLRTNNKLSPWPEEMNRQLTGRIASYHFAPTKLAQQNLEKENIPADFIEITGNTVIDALKIIIEKLNHNDSLQTEKDALFSKLIPKQLDLEKDKYILITGHRRENFGEGFLNICKAIKELAIKYPDVHWIYPVHLNPNVKTPVNQLLSDIGNVHLVSPLEYLPFVYLMSKSFFVITDSGGIQEEAPGLGKPVLVMRETTERPEAVEAGTVILVGTAPDTIIQYASKLLDDNEFYNSMSQAHNPYGDGKASIRIAEKLKEYTLQTR